MKLYSYDAPNPLRVQVFLAEKGLRIPTETVDLLSGEAGRPEFLKKNSLGQVPILELDDGSYLAESVAICRYLDALHPDTPLTGTTPQHVGRIEMWNRRIEQQIMGPIGQVGLHTFQFFADRIEQVPSYAETQLRLLDRKWAWLDQELSDGRTYVCDDSFSIADITGIAALMICGFAGQSVPEGLTHVKRWEAAMRARPSWQH